MNERHWHGIKIKYHLKTTLLTFEWGFFLFYWENDNLKLEKIVDFNKLIINLRIKIMFMFLLKKEKKYQLPDTWSPQQPLSTDLSTIA